MTEQAVKERGPLPWFRMYAKTVDDEKLRLLAFEDRWHFMALLCCKGLGIIKDASRELVRRKIAVKLGLDIRAFEEAMRRLAEVELIDLETLEPLDWDKTQARSDSSTTRVAAYRERQKQQAADNAPDGETGVKRSGNGKPPLPKRPRNVSSPLRKRKGNGLDIEKEGDKDSVTPSGVTGGGPPGRSPDEMTKDELWAAGKSLLHQGGLPLDQCGSFVGKLVKDYGPDLVMDAVRSAVVERPADAVSYLKATCQRLKGERKDVKPTVFDQGMANAAQAKRMIFGEAHATQ